jgi:CRP/FNR family cyclic AMP-dependent transcriptional regulator
MSDSPGGFLIQAGHERDFLRRSGWLAKTPVTFQDSVLARGHLSTFAAGKTIYDIDDAPGGMIGVVSGCASVTTISPGGVSKLSHILRPGEWFGVASILVREPRRVRISAQVPLQIFLLPVREIDAILGDPSGRSDAWQQFARLMIANSDLAVGVARDLMIRDSAIRCFAVILRLCGYRHSQSVKEEQPELELAQEDLAFLSNLSRNAVGSILRELEKAKVIELAYRRLKLLNPGALVDRLNRYELDNL